MTLDQLLERLKTDPAFRVNLTAWRYSPAQDARYGPWPEGLDPRLVEALGQRGISRLYTHQSSAVGAVLEGQDVCVVTSTASGKTLCYNLPVLHTILGDPRARALYLFPTKALSQDQYAELHGLIETLGADVKTYTYDGDTPVTARRAVRLAGHIVVTNPDMLHAGILPHHTKWQRLFENLRYVVVDELHHYRGVFGSHVANVLRRFRRVCEFYGSRPQFVCCSATIANPGELAQRLTGRPARLVDDDGSARGARHFVFYNPPPVNRELGIRRSALAESARLAGMLLGNDVQTIVFARSRVAAEVLLTRVRQATRLPEGAVRGYRGGYRPLQRREIEQGLRRGEVRGVVATNALELGIDVGQLEAAVLCGYPGTIASTWQQAGRAGRRQNTSLAIMVADSSPLDQFIVSHPDYFFGRSPEHALVNPDNLYVLMGHLPCAAFELPFQQGESYGAGDPATTTHALTSLEAAGGCSTKGPPRGGERGRLALVRGATTPPRASPCAPPCARTWSSWTSASRAPRCWASATPSPPPPWCTRTPSTSTRGSSTTSWSSTGTRSGPTGSGWTWTTTRTPASPSTSPCCWRRPAPRALPSPAPAATCASPSPPASTRRSASAPPRTSGWGTIDLPAQEMQTTAYWLAVHPDLVARLGRDGLQSGLLGLTHLLEHVAPLFLMCDPRDLVAVPQVKNPLTGRPTVFLCDNYPAGVGLAPKLYESHSRAGSGRAGARRLRLRRRLPFLRRPAGRGRARRPSPTPWP